VWGANFRISGLQAVLQGAVPILYKDAFCVSLCRTGA
jgi:hypothetical protein